MEQQRADNDHHDQTEQRDNRIMNRHGDDQLARGKRRRTQTAVRAALLFSRHLVRQTKDAHTHQAKRQQPGKGIIKRLQLLVANSFASGFQRRFWLAHVHINFIGNLVHHRGESATSLLGAFGVQDIDSASRPSLLALALNLAKISRQLNNTVQFRTLHLLTVLIHVLDVFNFKNRVFGVFFSTFDKVFSKFRLRIIDNRDVKAGRLIIKNRTEHQQEDERKQEGKEQRHFIADEAFLLSAYLPEYTSPIFFHTNPESPFLLSQ